MSGPRGAARRDGAQLDADRALVRLARSRQIVKGVVATVALLLVGYAGYEASRLPEAGPSLYGVLVAMLALVVWQIVGIVALGRRVNEARERLRRAGLDA